MITRLALFIGSPKPELTQEMRAYVDEHLAPLWRQFEGAHQVRVLWNIKGDPKAELIPLALQVDYQSEADIERAMASPARFESRDMLPEFYAKFWDEVRLEHHQFSVN